MPYNGSLKFEIPYGGEPSCSHVSAYAGFGPRICGGIYKGKRKDEAKSLNSFFGFLVILGSGAREV